ncbi:DEAD/DEAH box helicase [Clostridium chauvoei]|uniref:DEAD/DEAH box helicase n=2 Tax=Clostridium chauvoei TaxID=46867 RepID=A0ABD4RE50_9CLOT|nr:DEAD/DEAH box helicase [Clostridium chauvoei]ATD55085.1 helicase [Clostridium chauvoei]ATD57241.1 helicase [Clostridium chauvoei]MBX7279429.1 DEAD/DEAH box helicase [Clostridium chauvoei]MBX7282485.1 DEAD/DEAH box helicase [Clostridium chauvoei]MBX7285628.1 DEAD/DEAH box helicase [Clostridium chauvoei]
MMIKQTLLENFNRDTSGRNHIAGKRVFENDLISNFSINLEEDLIHLKGNVISEKFISEYSTEIEVDSYNKSIISTYCTCKNYEKNEFNKDNYCCKHLVATFYKFLQEIDKNKGLKDKLYYKKDTLGIFKKNTSSILNILLPDNKNLDELKIEVFINKKGFNNKITADFKIGVKGMSSNKLYVLKDLNQFLTAYYNKIPVKYGKDFTFDIKKQKLSTKDKRLLHFIEQLKELDNTSAFNRRQDKYVDGKSIIIPKYLLRDFFNIIKKHRIYLNEGFYLRPVEGEILLTSPEIQFDLKLIQNEYILNIGEGLPDVLSENGDVFLFGTTIYLPNYDFCYKIAPYLEVFSNTRSISIPKDEEKKILIRLIPEINLLSKDLSISKNIRDKVVSEPVEFKFYFDKEQNNISLVLKVKYGKYEFNIFDDFEKKIIYRDSKKEEEVLSILRSLGFDAHTNKFYLVMGDDYIFRFFKTEIEKLQNLGEVFYSENFKGLKNISSKNIKGEIRAGKYNYFEIEFKIGDISPDESTNILRAFRDNLKYYKLVNGEYLDLEQLELNNFLHLLDIVSNVDEIENNIISFDKNKGAFIDYYLDEKKIRYVKGKKELSEIRNKFKDINKLKFKEPKDLNAQLRPYQKHGFNWLKTLEYLGFGGILGDEMGLGKTLQMISFLLSNKDKSTIVITPTSLVYNWNLEFKKFAPSMKIAVVNGAKDEREEIIKNRDKFDVLLTTYNLLKRDLDLYKDIDFDYCILDEAQYIKNNNSQNSKAVKMIKANNRFALTGTPIENSLMELWSIFDFIMPGYLYDEKRFSVRYHKKLKESPEILEDLNRLIKPFILRRYKKEVIKELPSKIEKRLIVPLNEEQKKIYGVYSKHAIELISKKVKEDEFKNSKIEILSYITKLRQLCLDPSVLINDYTAGSGKIDALLELLHQSIEEGHKILVFSQFTSILKNISLKLKEDKIKYCYLDGSIPADKRMPMVEEFNNGDIPVFLISLKAGGTGLNLTSADIVIHFDPWWNPAVEDQATDRAHRLGQKNVVEVIKMIAEGTIEEKIVSLQDEKRKLISKLIGEDLASSKALVSLSEDEILNLFN